MVYRVARFVAKDPCENLEGNFRERQRQRQHAEDDMNPDAAARVSRKQLEIRFDVILCQSVLFARH